MISKTKHEALVVNGFVFIAGHKSTSKMDSEGEENKYFRIDVSTAHTNTHTFTWHNNWVPQRNGKEFLPLYARVCGRPFGIPYCRSVPQTPKIPSFLLFLCPLFSHLTCVLVDTPHACVWVSQDILESVDYKQHRAHYTDTHRPHNSNWIWLGNLSPQIQRSTVASTIRMWPESMRRRLNIRRWRRTRR